jgi:choice-of-anchor B domain-containing protein
LYKPRFLENHLNNQHMKKLALVACIVLLFSCKNDDNMAVVDDMNSVIDSRTICENGMAGNYPCNDYDLMSNISLTEMGASSGNDSWGWTDPTTTKEYALMGLNNGTAFIDISDPLAPIYLGKLPTAAESSTWRDIKVYQNYAFIVSEASGHGMQVFDLTKLRNVSAPPVTFTADTRYTGFGNAHNIVINESSGYAYPVGTSLNQGGPIFVNIQDPLNPVLEGGYELNGGSHDAQVVTYNGPDADYAGREILISSNGSQNGLNQVVIVDVTDKANPQLISSTVYSNSGYTHQGWFTDDQQYFLVGDELDELRFGFDTRTLVFDFTDLDAPVKLYDYTGPTAAIDHNGYINNNLFYLANYTAGVRFIDVSNISASLNEVGFFDTYPANNNASFDGVWSVYPFFESGNIIISDSSGGLFIVRKSGT